MEFRDFGEMASHATHVALACDEALHEGLKAVTKKLLKDTRDLFGSYQTGAGPFGTWQPLAQATKDDRVRQGFSPDDPLQRTGDLRDSFYAKVDRHEGGVGSDEVKALGMELGDPIKSVPARPTVGLAFARNEAELFAETGISLDALFIYGREVSRKYSSMVAKKGG